MSELKWYWAYRPYLDEPEKQKESALHAGYVRVVDKLEADKVIADLEKNLDLYKRGFKEDDRINAYLYAELRHQKYRRCLAMAKRCDVTALFYGNAIPKVLNKDITDPRRQKVFHRLRHYKKWHKRWLEIAEKFKPSKE